MIRLMHDGTRTVRSIWQWIRQMCYRCMVSRVVPLFANRMISVCVWARVEWIRLWDETNEFFSSPTSRFVSRRIFTELARARTRGNCLFFGEQMRRYSVCVFSVERFITKIGKCFNCKRRRVFLNEPFSLLHKIHEPNTTLTTNRWTTHATHCHALLTQAMAANFKSRFAISMTE